MIPVIFVQERVRTASGRGAVAEKQALIDAGKESAAVGGFSGAIGAYGGFFIPRSFGSSIELTGSVEAALYCFVAFSVTFLGITWRTEQSRVGKEVVSSCK